MRINGGRLQKSTSESELATEAECPNDGERWKVAQNCFHVDGCAYVPKSEFAKLEDFPELQKHAGNCLKESTLLEDMPLGIEVTDEASPSKGESFRFKTKTSAVGDRWIALADLCGVGQPWTDASCTNMCPAKLKWKQCIARRGCVYAYASNKKKAKVPKGIRAALEPVFGDCVAANGLIGSSHDGTKFLDWPKSSAEQRKKPFSDGGILVKGADPITGKGMKMLLSFPPEPQGVAGPVDKAKACKEGVDATRPVPASSWPSSAHKTEHLLQSCRCEHWRTVAEMGPVSEMRTDYQFAQQAPDAFMQVDYGCWRNVLSKELRMPVQFEYIASADTGNHKRSHSFPLDTTPGLLEWQHPLWSRSNKYGAPYDVGHLVMANHFDGSGELIHATNLMTNVLPQLGDMNRFAWLSTEYITECAREGADKENVFVMGGCVWPDAEGDREYIPGFEKMERETKYNPVSYKIAIPDFCWKVLSTKKRGHVAFYMPNTVASRISKAAGPGKDGVEIGLTALSQFVVSLSELEGLLKERQTPQTFGDESTHKSYKPSAQEMEWSGWSLRCDKK